MHGAWVQQGGGMATAEHGHSVAVGIMLAPCHMSCHMSCLKPDAGIRGLCREELLNWLRKASTV